jgi:hypothetical protein
MIRLGAVDFISFDHRLVADNLELKQSTRPTAFRSAGPQTSAVALKG